MKMCSHPKTKNKQCAEILFDNIERNQTRNVQKKKFFDENWQSNPQPPNFRQCLIGFFRGFSKSTEFFNQGWKMVMSYTE
jgi:predicted SnoaL-like aldol condensation-catalyzing enzyme